MSTRPSSTQWLALAVIAVAYVAFVVYAVAVLQQLFLALLPLALGVWIFLFYLLWRLVVAIESIAGALQRIASQREGE